MNGLCVCFPLPRPPSLTPGLPPGGREEAFAPLLPSGEGAGMRDRERGNTRREWQSHSLNK